MREYCYTCEDFVDLVVYNSKCEPIIWKCPNCGMLSEDGNEFEEVDDYVNHKIKT